jgi:DNA-binding NtrC family response regulator
MDIDMPVNVLLVNGSHNHQWADTLKDVLGTYATLVITLEADAINLIKIQKYDLVILDAVVVNDLSLLIARIKSQQPNTRVIVATSSPTWTRAREAFQAGAVDYMTKSLNKREILLTVKKALRKKNQIVHDYPD